ncbi:galactinol synthase [Klebsormidium nitens]|uniref:Hexosyltransferase n=1 Tax=Klebsormidium nitens TaxID=105231 RepID=A0A1Y1I6K6_KLENI|nr:galactinol synthase [Klebsormidium nitens]|eukprot:GAQ86153.1 galactinol synthase [Klebsormidium nitens]
MSPARRYCSVSDSLITKPKPRYAYLTFLVDGSDYWKGALALHKSLQLVGSRYPLVVAVTKEVPVKLRTLLSSHGCLIREIEDVALPESYTPDKYLQPYYITQYKKLRFWELTEFTKLCYLDADTIVLKNRDHLFDLIDSPSEIAGVQDCTCEGYKFHYRLCNTKYCQIEPSRAPWTFPDGKPVPAPYINAGFFMLMPNQKVAKDLVAKLWEFPPTGLAEQDYLNHYFEGRIKILPLANNLMLCNFWNHPTKVSVETAEMVHYCVAGSKPWRFDPSKPNMDHPAVQELAKKWHEIYGTDTTTPLGAVSPNSATLKAVVAAERPLMSRSTVGGVRVVA